MVGHDIFVYFAIAIGSELFPYQIKSYLFYVNRDFRFFFRVRPDDVQFEHGRMKCHHFLGTELIMDSL